MGYELDDEELNNLVIWVAYLFPHPLRNIQTLFSAIPHTCGIYLEPATRNTYKEKPFVEDSIPSK